MGWSSLSRPDGYPTYDSRLYNEAHRYFYDYIHDRFLNSVGYWADD